MPEVIVGTRQCAVVRSDPVDLAAGVLAVLREPRRSDGRARIEHLRHERIAERLVAVYHAATRPRNRLAKAVQGCRQELFGA